MLLLQAIFSGYDIIPVMMIPAHLLENKIKIESATMKIKKEILEIDGRRFLLDREMLCQLC